MHTMPDVAGNFDGILVGPGDAGNLMSPYFATRGGDGIAEGEDGFWIPGSGSRLELSRFGEVVGPENDDRI